ncbi:aspartic peptidase domain-containing protein [Thermothelomyces heterothallicus CBS 202.75]|uniref:aspartic peptidase domain-containing protein n=1 Tax=Thermothelomyces heterothallicus CBS 202.75 TaxID=1149848 RepID=UPI003742097E
MSTLSTVLLHVERGSRPNQEQHRVRPFKGAVQCAPQVSSSFTVESEIDGLAGLGFSSLNTVSPKSQLTFFDNAKPHLDSPVFTADLKANKAGTYDFGFVDKAKYTGNITYVPVNPYPGYWTFTASGYGVGSDNFSSSPIDGIADTGTSLLDISAYGHCHGLLSATLPSFAFGIGEAGQVDYPPLSSSGIGVNIWGDVALKAASAVFDGEDPPSIGWATKPLDE